MNHICPNKFYYNKKKFGFLDSEGNNFYVQCCFIPFFPWLIETIRITHKLVLYWRILSLSFVCRKKN